MHRTIQTRYTATIILQKTQLGWVLGGRLKKLKRMYKMNFQVFFASKPESFYSNGIKKLLVRWREIV